MAVEPLVSFALACPEGASCGDFPECTVFFKVLTLAMARLAFFGGLEFLRWWWWRGDLSADIILMGRHECGFLDSISFLRRLALR